MGNYRLKIDSILKKGVYPFYVLCQFVFHKLGNYKTLPFHFWKLKNTRTDYR